MTNSRWYIIVWPFLCFLVLESNANAVDCDRCQMVGIMIRELMLAYEDESQVAYNLNAMCSSYFPTDSDCVDAINYLTPIMYNKELHEPGYIVWEFCVEILWCPPTNDTANINDGQVKKQWTDLERKAMFETCRTTSKEVYTSLIWYNVECDNLYDRIARINIIDADLTRTDLFTVAPLRAAYDPTNILFKQTLIEIGNNNSRALAGITGGFFHNGVPDNICSFNIGQRLGNSLLQIPGGADTTLDAVNCLYARTSLALTGPGAPLISKIAPSAKWPYSVSDKRLRVALGAGPSLVTAGAVNVSTDEGFVWLDSVTARTAVAFTTANHMIGLTFDSKMAGHWSTFGISLHNLADFLVNGGLAAVTNQPDLIVDRAMNLDGGGSTTMFVRGEGADGLVNYPSDDVDEGGRGLGGKVRAIWTGLFVMQQEHSHSTAGSVSDGTVATTADMTASITLSATSATSSTTTASSSGGVAARKTEK